jgi:O-antigen ligase
LRTRTPTFYSFSLGLSTKGGIDLDPLTVLAAFRFLGADTREFLMTDATRKGRVDVGVPWANRLAECVVLTMVCAAPWMLGSVHAQSELMLIMGTGAVVILGAVSGRATVPLKNVMSLPSVALGGLVLLGLAQSTPQPEGMLAVLDPSTSALRRALLPDVPERVGNESAATIPLPPSTVSQEPGTTRETTWSLLVAWMLFQAVMVVGGGYDALRRFGWFVAANATLLALFALIQALTWNGKIYWVIPIGPEHSAWSVGGPFLSHTHLAEYLNVGLGFGLGFMLGGMGDRRPGLRAGRAIAVYVVGVLALGITTSQSRGGFLAMLGASLFTVMCLRSRRFRLWVGLVAVSAMVALFLRAMGDASPFFARLSTIVNSRDDAYQIRTGIWRYALRGWLRHPLWGTGLGTFGVSAPLFIEHNHDVYSIHAENEYVEMLLEGGCAGFGLALLGLAGIGLKARRAWIAAPTHADRALVLGASAGIVALAIQVLSDFGLHVPAISLLMVVLCGHLCWLGAERGAATSPAESGFKTPRSWLRVPIMAVMAALAVVILRGAVQRSQCEAVIASAGLTAPDTHRLTPTLEIGPLEELQRRRMALERSVQLRPDWTEGYLRLGLTNLAIYAATADDRFADSVSDCIERADMADPLRLLRLVREGEAETALLLQQEPIQRFLLPAARNFLEARRCCLVSPMAHAELGALSCLLESKLKPANYVDRVLLTAGGSSDLLTYAAAVAIQSGDATLAARCYRRALEADDTRWAQVADLASKAFSPNQILESVIPDNRGRYALMFADRLYATPDKHSVREKFLGVAAARLPSDLDLPLAERLWLEGRAWSELDVREAALRQMQAALTLEASRFEWRKDLIDRLITWGNPDEAHQQALIALQLSPTNPDAQKLVDQTAEAVARGAGSTGSETGNYQPR